ncbi:hypothetical protein K1719_002124 [Acacia pycnantha]|nr:hypothetical protein K1719_002124 [Acacia pycnantha]
MLWTKAKGIIWGLGDFRIPVFPFSTCRCSVIAESRFIFLGVSGVMPNLERLAGHIYFTKGKQNKDTRISTSFMDYCPKVRMVDMDGALHS